MAAFPVMPQERDPNSLLYLLERATILQAASNYAESAADFLAAAEVEERLEAGSLTRSSGSMLINDMTKAFDGAPFERVFLHAFAANNYLALGQVDDAAVEARNIVERLSADLNRFPDSAYARYLAGACLELTGESDGAAIEYRRAAALLKAVSIEPETGLFFYKPATNPTPAATNAVPAAGPAPYASVSVPPGWDRSLVCFVGIGVLGPAEGTEWRNPRWGSQPFADIYVNGVFAGRSVPLDDTHQLHVATRSRLAAARAAKTIVRTGLKFAIANAISERNEALGALMWFVLLGLETEDTRRWETLPRWLHAARVRCPDRIDTVRVVLRRSDGVVVEEQTLPPPPARSSRLTVTFTRAL